MILTTKNYSDDNTNIDDKNYIDDNTNIDDKKTILMSILILTTKIILT